MTANDPLTGREPTAPDARARARRLVRASGIFYGALLIASVLWAAVDDRVPEPFASLQWNPRTQAACALAAALAILVTALSAWGVARSRLLADLARVFRTLLGDPTPWQIFLLALFSSVAEEAFFRGALQSVLGLFWASLFFGVIHFIGPRYLAWTLFALVMGFALGGLYQYSGNLAAPVAAHFLINFLNFLRLRRAPPPTPDP
ncbi:MAG: CPBP family intramembrane metalloprotease [Planctomycetes bacterium]|nr:CPBP family intramembrane metalloprotease [Planctomycetota bacterium]